MSWECVQWIRPADWLVSAAALLQGDGEDGVGAGGGCVHGRGAHGTGCVPQLQAPHHLTSRQHLPLSQAHDLHGDTSRIVTYLYYNCIIVSFSNYSCGHVPNNQM